MEEPAKPAPTPPAPPWLLRLLPPEGGGGPAGAAVSPPGSATMPPGTANALPTNALGLALSGGGIRSAAFCLGVIQSLARRGWLPWVDYLSTVSGGGYVGAFLGRFFDLCSKPGGVGGAVPNRDPGAAQRRVAQDVADSRSAPVAWLRRNANYLSPTGLGEAATNVAGFWRNLLSIYLVLALFLLAAFGILNAIAYSSPRGPTASLALDFVSVLTPLGSHLPTGWRGPWVSLAEVVLWLAVVPLMAAYWLVSQDLPEAFIAPVLIAAAALAAALLVATASPLSVVALAAAVFWALGAWATVRRKEGNADPLNRARLLLARNHLTRRLAFWMGAMVTLAALGAVDGIGRGLARRMLDGGLAPGNVTMWFSSIGGSVLALAMTFRGAARFLIHRPANAAKGSVSAWPYVWAALVFLLTAVPPLVALSFASHAAYEAGEAYTQGLMVTGLALFVSLLLGSNACVPFINRSGPLSIYAARLARAFLGAVNPQRRVHPEGRNVTHVVPGDDVAFDQYAPHLAGGPLHLINCSVNETIDVASQRGVRDRQGENLAIGPVGVNVGQRWHALWAGRPASPATLAPVAADDGPHPFLSRSGDPVEVEPLDLREWVAISGGAVSPGMGRQTSLARCLLLTLANLRLGYWWDSGLTSSQRHLVPVKFGLWRSITDLLSKWFRAQSLLLSEAIGRFGGPWFRFWYLSDGGNFEVTGAYELLRRRVPFVIVCDAGQDRGHQGTDLATLVRLARIDFGAEIEETDPATVEPYGVPEPVARCLGTLGGLLAPVGDPSRTHAVLLRVRYPRASSGNPSGDAWLGRNHTWLLYLKATLTGDEQADVRNYAALHPDFPNESTLDQAFDEPQWESYRKLGEHVGDGLFVV